MAEQGRIVVPAAGAIGRRGQLTSNAVKLHNATSVASYDSGSMRFTTYLRRPSKTGFTSNQRPAIYYRPSLDHVDNPQFGLLLSDSFVSQTKRHYQPHIRADCSGSSTNIVNKPTPSGFHQLRIQPKPAPVEEKTEFQSVFVPHRPTPAVSKNNVTVGPKGGTGFTRAAELQVNTSFLGDHYQIPSSVMKADIVPFSLLQGTEAKPGVCRRSCRETGFTRGDITTLAHPSSLLPSPKANTKAPTVLTIGKKEPTGHVLNNEKKQVFPNTPLDSSNFTTHYNSKFRHRADLEKLKPGSSCTGIVSSKMENGYNRRDMDRYILGD